MTSFSHNAEPLEPELWFNALARLAQRQRAASGGNPESMLRHAFHLAQLTPGPLRGIVRCELCEDDFGVLLEHAAFDAAAIALVGLPLCFAIRGTAGGGRRLVTAEVTFSDQQEQPSAATCQTVAGALVGAWSLCLVDLRQRSLQDPLRSPRRVRRTAPDVPRPKAIEH
jgi:hypothetical protein